MPIVIDVQGFKTEKNRFLVKELAAYDGCKICHYVFKPPFTFDCLPYEYQKQANWLTANHHCIKWGTGFVPLHKFSAIIPQLTDTTQEVYVKGKEKADYIQKYTRTPILELPDSPAIQQEGSSCFYHSKNLCICALTNVYNLYNQFIMQ